MGSEYGSTASETSERSKTSGCKSPNAHHARCIRTKEAEPLTEATLIVSLKQLVSEIGREFKNALANKKDRHRTSEPPVQEDVVKELVNLKREMIESCLALMKDIGAMSRAFSNKVTIAITTTRQHAETMNQGSLQAIFNQLANRTPFINGNTQVPSSSSSDPIPGNGPIQGTFLFEEDPCIPAQEKGKGHADDPGSPKSEPKPSVNSPAPLGLSPITGPSHVLPQSPNPLELKEDQPWWHTLSPGRTPAPSPCQGRAPLVIPQGHPYENGGPGGDLDGGGDNDDDGGRGGGGGPPPPGDPPGDPDGGSTGDPPVEPLEGSRERNPRTGGTSQTTAPSGAPERATTTPGGYHGYDWRQLDPAHQTSIAPHGRTPGKPAGLSCFDAFHFRIQRGITQAICRVIKRETPTGTPATFAKSVAAVTPIPQYGGGDDLKEFMRWLQKFLNFVDIHQLVGIANDYNRTLTLGSAMEGTTLSWFNLNIRGPLFE